jgi:hypothetical protein
MQPINQQKILKIFLELTVDTAIIFLIQSFEMYKTQDKICGFVYNVNTLNVTDGTDMKT